MNFPLYISGIRATDQFKMQPVDA